jgi:hypothetical protein
LPFRFDLLSQSLFHFSAFLNVAGFELSAFLRTQMEAGVPNRRFSLPFDGLTAQILSLPHDVALLRTHPHPALGVALEILPSFWRKCLPPLAYARA